MPRSHEWGFSMMIRWVIDSDYSTPPAFPFRVLYGSQPRFHGFRLPDKLKFTTQPRVALSTFRKSCHYPIR